MKFKIFAALWLAACCVSANGADELGLLTKFEGEWHSADPAFGMQAKSRMTWKLVLDDRFYRLDYKIMMKGESESARIFQGVAYYQVIGEDVLEAFWADNSGDLHPIKAERDGNALVANWGVKDGKQGRTRYELLSEDQMEITDWIRTGNEWRQFNQGMFTRAEN